MAELEVELRTPNDLPHHMVNVDTRMLGKDIFSAWTGRRPFENVDITNAEHQGQVYVAAVCQDLIVRALDPSFHMEKSQPTRLIELMARMRLIKSRKTLVFDVARRALQSMREKVDLGTHGIVAASGDNVDWKATSEEDVDEFEGRSTDWNEGRVV